MLTPGRFKEKNRTAQKRYRERQKSKLQESEEKVAELTEQLNSLKVEKVGRRQLSCKAHRVFIACLMLSQLQPAQQ